MKVFHPLGPSNTGGANEFILPDHTDVLEMNRLEVLKDPGGAVEEALKSPIGTATLREIVNAKISSTGKYGEKLTACIVISDNTRPVPYKGESGILMPVINQLISVGIVPNNITVLVATGTHRGLRDDELRQMLDKSVFTSGVLIENHDCKDVTGLSHLGKTNRGSEILINSRYVESDIKILTGLVESHFMAGVSGGRKSLCPGLVGEKSTNIFHGALMMGHPNTTAMQLDGNPCHEESLEMAKAAGADFIVNVTLDGEFRTTGVFAGDLEKAHLAAVEQVRKSVIIPVQKHYDIVVTHAGFVGINHYQAAKAGVEAARIVKEGGYVLMAANNTDSDPVGSLNYRTVLQLLKLNGVAAFEKLLMSKDWEFIPEQWQVQMWNRLFSKIPFENFYYFSPQFREDEYFVCPGNPMTVLSGITSSSPAEQLSLAVETLVEEFQFREGRPPAIAWMKDGPYGVCEY